MKDILTSYGVYSRFIKGQVCLEFGDYAMQTQNMFSLGMHTFAPLEGQAVKIDTQDEVNRTTDKDENPYLIVEQLIAAAPGTELCVVEDSCMAKTQTRLAVKVENGWEVYDKPIVYGTY